VPHRVPPVGGLDGARSLARAHSVPAPRRRGTGPRQTPLGHRRRHGAMIIIRSAARRQRWLLLFLLFRFFAFPAQGRSRPVSRGRSYRVPKTGANSGGDSGGGGETGGAGDAAPPPRVRLAEK